MVIVGGAFSDSTTSVITNSGAGAAFLKFLANQTVTNAGAMSFFASTAAGAGATEFTMTIGTSSNNFFVNTGTVVFGLPGVGGSVQGGQEFVISNQFVNTGTFLMTNNNTAGQAGSGVDVVFTGSAGGASTNLGTIEMVQNNSGGGVFGGTLTFLNGGFVNQGTLSFSQVANSQTAPIILAQPGAVFSNAVGAQLVVQPGDAGVLAIQADTSVNLGTNLIEGGTLSYLTHSGAANVFTNKGVVLVNGGNLVAANGIVNSNGLIGTTSGSGTLVSSVVNLPGATLEAGGGTLVLLATPSQLGFITASNGTFQVGNTGTLVWSNAGTILLQNGTIFSGVLTNTASGQITGAGTLLSAVGNLGLINATGNLTLVAGLLGGTNSGTLTAQNGGTLNIGPTDNLALSNAATINLLGGTLKSTNVFNLGTGFIGGAGLISNAVRNLGTITASNGTLTVFGGLLTGTNSGTLSALTGGSLVIGSASNQVMVNSATIALQGGTLFSGIITNLGGGYIGNFGAVSAAVRNLGLINATNGNLILASGLASSTNSGTLSAGAGGTLIIGTASNLFVNNSDTITLQGGALFSGNITNLAGSVVSGFGSINANTINLANVTATNGQLQLNDVASGPGAYQSVAGTGAATLTFAGGGSISALFNTGATIRIETGPLTNTSLFVNQGTVALAGGTYQSAANFTNVAGRLIVGSGTIDAPLFDQAGAFINATNGTLRFLQSPVMQGVLNVSSAATAQFGAAGQFIVTNAASGSINLFGGTLVSSQITNAGLVAGFGTISGSVANSGQIFVNGGSQALRLNGAGLVNQVGGVITANVGRLIVSGVYTNSGTLSMINSIGTFTSAVVNRGAWITDPTTNVFQNTYTVASSGFIQSGPGDLYIFTNNATTAASFINVSTNKTQYNTLNGDFRFASTLGVTQEFATAGHNFEPPQNTATNQIDELTHNLLSLPGYSNNFALGTLEISSYTTVRVDDAFITGGAGTDDNLQAALYLNNLDMGVDSLLMISSNVQVYFINSNNWSLANVQLQGNPAYDQSFDGIHQLVVVPEPAVALLWLSSVVTVYAARRRNARSSP